MPIDCGKDVVTSGFPLRSQSPPLRRHYRSGTGSIYHQPLSSPASSLNHRPASKIHLPLIVLRFVPVHPLPLIFGKSVWTGAVSFACSCSVLTISCTRAVHFVLLSHHSFAHRPRPFPFAASCAMRSSSAYMVFPFSSFISANPIANNS